MATCECGAEIPTGCTCAFEDTVSVVWTGGGVAANPAVPGISVDPDSTNQLQLSASGLRATLPSRFINVPRIRLRHSVNQSITSSASVFTAVSYDTEVYDTDAMHGATTSEIMIVTPGLYRYGGTWEWAANATGSRATALVKNGQTLIDYSSGMATQDAIPTIVWMRGIDVFSAGDVLQTTVAQDSGVSLNLVATNEMSPIFWMTFRGDQP